MVFVLAFVARVAVIFDNGHIRGLCGYDCGTYFTGADAFIHGRLPYRDFVMLHPPGIMLFLTPFAALTKIMSDSHAFAIANLGFCVLGAVNATLVVVICRRLGLSTWCGVVGGLFYAAWFGSVAGEYEVKLEPLGNLALLGGVLLILRAQRVAGRRAAILAGAVLGLTTVVKIWWFPPVIVLVGWHAWRQRSIKAGLDVLAGAALAALIVDMPFFLAAPSAMWHSVVLDQLGRLPANVADLDRISAMTTVPDAIGHHLVHSTALLVVTPFVVVALVVGASAWRASPAGRFAAGLVAVQIAVLLLAPSWFLYYGDYIAVSLSMTIAVALSGAERRGLAWLHAAAPWALTATMLSLTIVITVSGTSNAKSLPGQKQLARAVARAHCVTSDYPTLLIEANALSRDLDHGCPNWVDVTGDSYGPDREGSLPRSQDVPYQKHLVAYLRSGDQILLYPGKAAITAKSRAKIGKGRTIVLRTPDYVLLGPRRARSG
ncbi:hypothetical protein [Jatrophihabitans sp.]|uniref:hypothetical protein n=1 Tax=Jatrophihabitans sp. TaxID=1932789 RepID=UPI0030C69437|nr:hypothetical protein [Jatrophihabitans sp.]